MSIFSLPSMVPFEEEIILAWHTGSFYICDPPVTTSDRDYLLLVEDMQSYFNNCLRASWFTCGSSDVFDDKKFLSVRRGINNLIITDNKEWFFKFAAATELAKRLNIQDKDSRIALFELVLGENKK